MIKSKDLYKEIEIIEAVAEKQTDELVKAQLKAQVLHLKLLHNIRTNLTVIMEHFKIALIKPEDGKGKDRT